MERLEAGMTDIHTSISALQRSLPAIIKYELRLDRLERTVNRSAAAAESRAPLFCDPFRIQPLKSGTRIRDPIPLTSC